MNELHKDLQNIVLGASLVEDHVKNKKSPEDIHKILESMELFLINVQEELGYSSHLAMRKEKSNESRKALQKHINNLEEELSKKEISENQLFLKMQEKLKDIEEKLEDYGLITVIYHPSQYIEVKIRVTLSKFNNKKPIVLPDNIELDKGTHGDFIVFSKSNSDIIKADISNRMGAEILNYRSEALISDRLGKMEFKEISFGIGYSSFHIVAKEIFG